MADRGSNKQGTFGYRFIKSNWTAVWCTAFQSGNSARLSFPPNRFDQNYFRLQSKISSLFSRSGKLQWIIQDSVCVSFTLFQEVFCYRFGNPIKFIPEEELDIFLGRQPRRELRNSAEWSLPDSKREQKTSD